MIRDILWAARHRLPLKKLSGKLTLTIAFLSLVKIAVAYIILRGLTSTKYQDKNRLLPVEDETDMTELSNGREDNRQVQVAAVVEIPAVQQGVAQEAIRRKRRDWTDHDFVEAEKLRVGPGEQGSPVELSDSAELERSKLVIDEYAHNGVVSDKISLDRALPDPRHPNCMTRTYYEDLPPVSIVIVFHDEYLSPLLRTLHSLINRTPKSLLTEIILVDDCSTKDFLKAELDEHVRNYHPEIIRILRLTERKGLSKARTEGTKAAKSEIVVILDAHIEVNTNWLPPLIEPIVDDYQTVTEPLVYHIDSNSYSYENITQNGWREVFRWSFTLTFIKRELRGDSSLPYENPTVLGGLMAFNKSFFWELEGYDEGLEVWGGEQWDFSFKVWRCSEGTILTVPCSQIGHNFKSLGQHPFFRYDPQTSYIMKNSNRIAEIWLDSPYKEFYREKAVADWVKWGTGDVSEMLEYRQRKQCKSLRWYLDNVYPEFDLLFPMKVNRVAQGTISSFAYPRCCIDTFGRTGNIGLSNCTKFKDIPERQLFIYTPLNEIRANTYFWDCWDSNQPTDGHFTTISISPCHYEGGNQFYIYDPENFTITHQRDMTCLQADPTNPKFSLYFTECTGAENQKWLWTSINKKNFKRMQKAPIAKRPQLIQPPPLNRRKINRKG